MSERRSEQADHLTHDLAAGAQDPAPRPPASDPFIALYPGTFDPIHNGHLDLIRRSSFLFHRVIVGIYDKPAKNLLFTTEERVQLVRESIADLSNVSVENYAGLTIEYAASSGARAIIRGLRATSDFDFEFQVALMNRHLNPTVEAVFLMTSLEHAHLSSTLVKEIAQLGARLEGLVPPPVARALRGARERGS
ncbi:MAG: pantetheine-phosphate adenylyltransferase [Chloroflexi bacterium]|nr:pantetheine-phosphate adenylyltransferase [Chloroflexota bacterium]